MLSRANQTLGDGLPEHVNPKCPHCGSESLHQSRRRSIIDHVLRIFELRPYRCEDCDFRFYRRGMLPTDKNVSSHYGPIQKKNREQPTDKC